MPDSSPYNPNSWALPLKLPVLLGIFGTMIFAQVYRYIRVSNPVQRQQTKWVVYGGVVAIAVMFVARGPLDPGSGSAQEPFRGLLSPLLQEVGWSLLPATLAIAILRYRLWDINVVINRTLVYGGLTVTLAGIYMLIVGGASAAFQTPANPLLSFLAAGLIAVLFQPLRLRLQRWVNHLMYGERDDPYAVLSRLGAQLEATLSVEEVFPAIVRTITEALKIPYAAILLEQGGCLVPLASAGTPTADAFRMPVSYRGEQLGEMLVGLRAPGEAFGTADQRLLTDLARQTGVAAQAARLTVELQRSRERLVLTREEERRRLRRDLHDGLGPALAAQTLKAGSARKLYPRDPIRADQLMAELESNLEEALADVRRLVYNLRPPVLDELGLVAAIRECADEYALGERLAEDGHPGIPDITVSAPDCLPALPAAVEVAAYRIAQEALTNVVRHALARQCWLRLDVDRQAEPPALELSVSDDGVGILEGVRPGVGLMSMRERATELGGTIGVTRRAEGGTTVSVRLPLASIEYQA